MSTKEIFKEIISWVQTIIITVLIALFINNVLIVNAEIPTGSMEDTIIPNDKIITFRLSYLLKDPKRFDIVVFKYPDDEEILYVKRIIGLPGEIVELNGGKIYIDGDQIPLDETFIDKHSDSNITDGIYEVPENHYFMLGDNRDNSKDSRYWDDKFVEKKKILGRAVFKYYPKFKILNKNLQDYNI